MLRIMWEKLQTSIWIIPLLMSVAAALLAIALVSFDLALYSKGWVWPTWMRVGADGARQVLSVTTGAMMTITGVVFSITIVALTLAANQFGPKILRSYLRDTGNKLVLGLFISSFLYGLVVLTSIDSQQTSFIPITAFMVSLLFTIIAVVGLIYFIHNISTSIQADHMISIIGDELTRTIEHTLAPTDTQQAKEPLSEKWKIATQGCHQTVICSNNSGYVEYIHYQKICSFAQRAEAMCELTVRAGDFIIENTQVAILYTSQQPQEKAFIEAINAAITTSRQRTPVQDLEYAITQLMQIALRALSPGINDSLTAISCIDWLSASLGRMAGLQFPSHYHKDDQDIIRMKARSFDFEGAANAVFDPLRQNARNNEMVMLRILDALANIIETCTQADNLRILRHHAELIYQSARHSFTNEADVEQARLRYAHCNAVYERQLKQGPEQTVEDAA